MSESAVLADIRLDLGRDPTFMILRINTGVFRPMHGPLTRAIRSAPNGTPDLLGVWRGRALAIETKYRRGEQMQSQLAFQARWEACGGIYIVARSVADVRGRLEKENG